MEMQSLEHASKEFFLLSCRLLDSKFNENFLCQRGLKKHFQQRFFSISQERNFTTDPQLIMSCSSLNFLLLLYFSLNVLLLPFPKYFCQSCQSKFTLSCLIVEGRSNEMHQGGNYQCFLKWGDTFRSFSYNNQMNLSGFSQRFSI